jgi:hypothetical protein
MTTVPEGRALQHPVPVTGRTLLNGVDLGGG